MTLDCILDHIEARRRESLSAESRPLGKEIIQVGILVRDVSETAKRLEKLIGIGPFEILGPDYRDLTYRGKSGKFKMRIALARAVPIQIELMQPLHGEMIYDEFAKRRGYGLHHLGIKTDNMEESVKEMEEGVPSNPEREPSRRKVGLSKHRRPD